MKTFKIRINSSFIEEFRAVNETYALAMAARAYPDYNSLFIV